MNSITIIGLFAAVCTTFSFLPQAMQTIESKHTKGISFFMYALLVPGTFLWVVYGILSYNLPVILANGISLIFAVIILGYKIKYK